MRPDKRTAIKLAEAETKLTLLIQHIANTGCMLCPRFDEIAWCEAWVQETGGRTCLDLIRGWADEQAEPKVV